MEVRAGTGFRDGFLRVEFPFEVFQDLKRYDIMLAVSRPIQGTDVKAVIFGCRAPETLPGDVVVPEMDVPNGLFAQEEAKEPNLTAPPQWASLEAGQREVAAEAFPILNYLSASAKTLLCQPGFWKEDKVGFTARKEAVQKLRLELIEETVDDTGPSPATLQRLKVELSNWLADASLVLQRFQRIRKLRDQTCSMGPAPTEQTEGSGSV